jgi:hypothetical protein
VCRCLRTKKQYVAGAADQSVWDRGSTTAGYWCLRTMHPFGPDEGQVRPRECRAGRNCFEGTPEDPQGT